jgi:flagellar hook assembly protein FlgD
VGNFPTFRTNDGVGVGVPEIAAGPSIGLRFDSLHPNPTRRRSTVQFSLERAHAVRVDVVDVTGRRVSTLADDVRPAGRHEVDWDGTDSDGQRVASGVYYVRVSAGALAEAKAVTIVR